ncbi:MULTISPECIES: delta-class carbonic anhydrase [Pseudomonadota]|uniref:delta-class carbonic anhydrase n=1 Tax=Pseudomonadota TaxID=1224 RepID=UPI003267990D
MKRMFSTLVFWFSLAGLLHGTLIATAKSRATVSDEVIKLQRAALAAATEGQEFGPQSPRDIDRHAGRNRRVFGAAPNAADMTLCDIHFHKNAEHKGGEFTKFAGNGDGGGYGTGFTYDGRLSALELAKDDVRLDAVEKAGLVPGDTIEIHFVYSSARATLGNGLGTCLSKTIANPQLRVEAVVAVLVGGPGGAEFGEMALIQRRGRLNQTPNLPVDLGTPVVYAGSTTGPSFNEIGSPYQVTWSVRPRVVKVSIASLDRWLSDNPFDETRAHGVRNLVVNPDLLSPIK